MPLRSVGCGGGARPECTSGSFSYSGRLHARSALAAVALAAVGRGNGGSGAAAACAGGGLCAAARTRSICSQGRHVLTVPARWFA